jgi:hypothetical protein
VEELIIGFDCREMWLPNSETDPLAKKDHLLKLDIQKLLTIDRTQWKSVFVTHYIRKSDDDTDVCWGTAPGYHLETPSESLTSGWFWDNLDAMRAFIEKHEYKYQKLCWLIAITVAETPEYQIAQAEKDPGFWGTFIPAPLLNSPKVSSAWTLLGYDVEDGAPCFWEGLQGGSWPHELLDAKREKWGVHLNKYHLFKAPELAYQFALNELERRSIPSPFLVYGLYLVDIFPKITSF